MNSWDIASTKGEHFGAEASSKTLALLMCAQSLYNSQSLIQVAAFLEVQ